MWAQAVIIDADHHRDRRKRKQGAVRRTQNVPLNPGRQLSCQGCSRSSMKMLQRQGFDGILNCEGPNATLARLLNAPPSHQWISLAFTPKNKLKRGSRLFAWKVLPRYAWQGMNADREAVTGRRHAAALSTAVWARRRGPLNTARPHFIGS